MKKRLAGCKGIYERIKADRKDIGLKTFVEVPTEQAKVEQMPLCFMVYGVDSIVKRSSRSASASRKSDANIRSVEVILQLVAQKKDDIMDIFSKLREAIFTDIHPALNENNSVDTSVHMYEERLEGPLGYGIPNVEALIFVITLVYPDEN